MNEEKGAVIMKVFSVCGYSQSGKTTSIEYIIRELIARGYKVGSVKEIHFEGFSMDSDGGSNTVRHRAAGAGLVTARGLSETDVMFPAKLDIRKILSFYEGFDYVVCEGVRDAYIPMILTANTLEDLDKNWNDYVFCVSGRIADSIGEYRGIPAFSAPTASSALVDFIEDKAFDLLPGVTQEQCGTCGGDCREMALRILRGLARREDCVSDQGAELIIDGQRVGLVPFVQKALQGTVLGFIGELKGYKKDAEIIIKIPRL